MEMANFINFLFCNTISNYYYIASIITLMISTGHIQSRVIIDFISSLLASKLFQLIEWPLKLSLFFYAVVPTIRCHGFKYTFAVLFLVVDLLINTFLTAQIPLQGAMACFDGPQECCGFIHYDIQKGPAELWMEFLSRTLVTFYICCSICVIVSKKNEIVEFVQIWYRFIAANIFRVFAVFNIFVFLIRFKYQEIGVFMLVVYMASRRLFEAWFPMYMERTLDVMFHDAVEPQIVAEQTQTSYEDCNDSPEENQNEDSDDAGDNSNEPDENSDEDKNEGTDEGSDDDLDENGDMDNNDDEDCDEDDEDCDEGDEDCDEEDDEDQDDENDENPDRVPEDINEDVDDDERCSLM